MSTPAWPAPPTVGAAFTTRAGGASDGSYASFNLATHVGDAPAAVARNRALLAVRLGHDVTPCWLEQVHGNAVRRLHGATDGAQADASITTRPGLACAVMVADCVPVLLCADDGSEVAAAHAGWRGLARGVLEATVAAFRRPPSTLLAWVGPAIGVDAYQVGADLRAQLMAVEPVAAACFVGHHDGYSLDLHALARQRLARAGVGAVFGQPRCVYAEPDRFFSHRRESPCGRMAALIWIKP